MLTFVVQTPLARGVRRLATPPRFGNFRRLPDQSLQALQGVRTVALLRTEALRKQAELTR